MVRTLKEGMMEQVVEGVAYFGTGMGKRRQSS
jgi:hypothetical protein